MKTVKTFFLKNIPYIISFLIPSSIIILVFFQQNIWWKSKISPLLGDGFHQYVIFDITLRNILHGTDSIFYTFTSGLGLNFYALISYYLGSFLSPLTYFFDAHSMPDAVYLLTIVKFGFMGLSAFVSIKGIFKNISNPLLLMLSTSYSLMSFTTSQMEIKTWLDVFILVPLILYGLHLLVIQKNRILYFTTLSILFIQNYYFGFMMAIFLTLWYFVQICWDFKKRSRSFLDFIIVSILSTITSMIMLLPTFLDLQTHGERLTGIDRIINEGRWFLDIFSKNLVGSFDTTKYGSIPMIYVGLFPLLLAVLFFFLKSVRIGIKLLYLGLIGILIASFYLQPLDLLWQGMHAPNMFLHRYSWLFSILIIFLAAESLSRIQEIHFKNLLLSFSFIGVGFCLTFIFRNRYNFLNYSNFILTIVFLLSYLCIFSVLIKRIISLKLFAFSILFLVNFEIFFNTCYQVKGIAKEWGFANRTTYEENLYHIDRIVKFLKSSSDEFFRMEKIEIQTGNDSMKYNYNGISQFSSIRNTITSSTLDKLGFRSEGTNLNLRYQNNTILMDSLFGVKYNLTNRKISKEGFKYLLSHGNVNLYENTFSKKMVFLTKNIYKDVNFNNLTLDNQTKFVNQITDLKLNYFSRTNPINSQNTNDLNGRIIVTSDETKDNNKSSVTYIINTKKESQLYITLPNITFSNDDCKLIELTIGDNTITHDINNTFSFLNAGHLQPGEQITVRLTFPENTQVSFDNPEFYLLDIENYHQAMHHIDSQNVKVTTNKNTISVSYSSQKETSLFFTLPYDRGWTAYKNGKKIPIFKAQNSFMRVTVPKGQGTIKLVFIPQGFKVGVFCFTFGIFFFLLYDKKRKKS